MLLFTAGVATESNTFAPMPSGLDDFSVFRGSPPENRPTSFTQPFLGIGWRTSTQVGYRVYAIL